MKLLAFAASSSKNSINKHLVTYASHLLPGATVEVLDLNDYELPLFNVDRESELGHPALAKAFLLKIEQCDALIISFAEHNGAYTAAYKNVFDWCSRINTKVFQNKPMVLLSTSPGARGGASVLAAATAAVPRFGGRVLASLSVPSFNDNFDVAAGQLKTESLDRQLREAINLLVAPAEN
jgi:NAD(P)H-dependent FMN reductase